MASAEHCQGGVEDARTRLGSTESPTGAQGGVAEIPFQFITTCTKGSCRIGAGEDELTESEVDVDTGGVMHTRIRKGR